MKASIIYFVLFASTSTFAGVSDTATVNRTIRNILKKLEAINYLHYDYYIESNYISENYRRNVSKKVFMEFDKQEPILGLIFTDTEKEYASVFNGKEYFYINKKAKTVELTETPTINTFRSQTSFVNSYYALKHFLPVVLASISIDRSTADTTINGNKFSTLSFTLKNYMMGRFGKLEKLSVKKNITYTVILAKDGLPLQVVQRDDVNPADYTLVQFTNIVINKGKPSSDEWKYEKYAKLYKPVVK